MIYELVNSTPKEVFITYIAFLSACILTVPFVNLIYTAIKGVSRKWR